MRVSYVTFDEVNRFSIQNWAEEDGFQLHCPSASELSAIAENTDAIVLDLDYLPVEIRSALLKRIHAGLLRGRVLVHGHNIGDAESKKLRQRGVRICRGVLRRHLFRSWLNELCRGEKKVYSRVRTAARANPPRDRIKAA